MNLATPASLVIATGAMWLPRAIRRPGAQWTQFLEYDINKLGGWLALQGDPGPSDTPLLPSSSWIITSYLKARAQDLPLEKRTPVFNNLRILVAGKPIPKGRLAAAGYTELEQFLHR